MLPLWITGSPVLAGQKPTEQARPSDIQQVPLPGTESEAVLALVMMTSVTGGTSEKQADQSRAGSLLLS